MKKILLDVYLAKNLGDDLFMDVFLKKYPNSLIKIKDCPKDYSKILEKYPNVEKSYSNCITSRLKKIKLYNIIRSIIYSKKYDAYVMLGGSILMETKNWENLYNERKSFIDAFNNNNKTTYILGANFGPFKSINFKDKYNELFNKITDISFRDTYSFNLFKPNKSNIRLNPDIIFSLKESNKKDINTLGISIIDLEKRNGLEECEDTYISNICEIIKKSYREKYRVTLLSFCDREGDLKAITKIKNKLPIDISNSIDVYNYDGDLEYALNVLSKFEMIISTRFHSMILSQVYNQGVLPFIYSDKTLNILNDIGLDNLYVDIRDNNTIDIEKIWDKIQQNKMNIDIYRNKSLNHFDKLDNIVKDNKVY